MFATRICEMVSSLHSNFAWQVRVVGRSSGLFIRECTPTLSEFFAANLSFSGEISRMVDSSFFEGFASGVASGIGKEVTQRVWTSAEAWLKEKYLGHTEAVLSKARANSAIFLNQLGLKISALEEESEISKSLLASVMDEPNFSVLFQKAVLASAQTDDNHKYEILSDLITERVKAPSESIFGVTSQMAVDAIAHCTSNQLRLLGALAALKILSPAERNQESSEDYLNYFGRWLVRRIAPYEGLAVRIHDLDIAHLLSVACAAKESVDATFETEDDLKAYLNKKIRGSKVTVTTEFLERLPVKNPLKIMLCGPLRVLTLTTVGQLVGTLVSDKISGSEVSRFTEWHSTGTSGLITPTAVIRAMEMPFE